MRRYVLAVLAILSVTQLAFSDPTTLYVFTSFESGDVGPTFGFVLTGAVTTDI